MIFRAGFNKYCSFRNQSAFTLIELLIVVAIIAILAAIAVPNFLEAQTRSKVSRTKADMRSLAVAVEAYATDNNNKYPAPDFPTWELPHGLGSSGSVYEYKANGMTTPISYITSIPNDPFAPGHALPEEVQTTDLKYYYSTKKFFQTTDLHAAVYPWRTTYNTADSVWAGTPIESGPWTPEWNLQSRGPDQILRHTWISEETGRPMKFVYDPTNGTISVGNIVRVGP
jgi:prepilin-type N-terminal cleavage/methylation domain-containing protein